MSTDPKPPDTPVVLARHLRFILARHPIHPRGARSEPVGLDLLAHRPTSSPAGRPPHSVDDLLAHRTTSRIPLTTGCAVLDGRQVLVLECLPQGRRIPVFGAFSGSGSRPFTTSPRPLLTSHHPHPLAAAANSPNTGPSPPHGRPTNPAKHRPRSLFRPQPTPPKRSRSRPNQLHQTFRQGSGTFASLVLLARGRKTLPRF